MASGDEEGEQLWENVKKDSRQLYEKVVKYPLISLFLMIAVLLLIALPHWQVSGINNSTVQAAQENQDRTTLAQIFGGVAIGIGLYYTWRRITIAEEDLKATQENLKVAQDNLKVTQDNLKVTQKVAQDNLKVAQEGQITERFTRAVDQLGAIDQFGNRALEIRLGGIYALERISKESDTDYWPIIEIFTAYTRKNSPIKNGNIKIEDIKPPKEEYLDTKFKVHFDIQAILTIIGRRKYFLEVGEPHGLELRETYLRMVNLKGAHLEGAYLYDTDLIGAYLEGAYLKGAYLNRAYLNWAYLKGANLERANLRKANLEGANLEGANLREVNLEGANLEGANLREVNLEGANLVWANFEGANLEWAHLEGADLTKASLEGANFRGAYLEGAILIGVDLKEAESVLKDLRTHNLEIDQLSRVKTLYHAELDDNLLIPLKENCPKLFEVPDEEPDNESDEYE